MPHASSPTERVTVNVWGGLGNRLFMIAAGFLESTKLGCPLSIYTDSRFTDVSKLLGGLDPAILAGVPVEAPDAEKSAVGLRRRVAERLGGAVRSYLPLAAEETASGQLADSVVDGVRIRDMKGYFQDFFVVEQAVERGWPRTVRLPEDSMVAARQLRAQLPQNYVGIHMRLGDYLQPVNQKKLGLPSLEYFRGALDAITTHLGDSLPVVVFSDSPQHASGVLADVGIRSHKILGPLDTSSDAQTLWLLSQASAVVLSNSTFGWWGAYWGGSDRPVACPAPWHDRVNSQALVDPTWIQVAKNP